MRTGKRPQIGVIFALFLALCIVPAATSAEALSDLTEAELRDRVETVDKSEKLAALGELMLRGRHKSYDDLPQLLDLAESLQVVHPDAALRSQILHHLSWYAVQQGNLDAGLSWAQESFELSAPLGDSMLIGWSQYSLGVAFYYRSDSDEALAAATAAVEAFEQETAQPEAAMAHTLLGVVYRSRSNYNAALAHHVRSLEISESLEDADGIARARNNIGLIHWKLEQYEEAYRELEHAANHYRNGGVEGQLATVVSNLGLVLIELGEPRRALEYLEEGLALDAVQSNPNRRAKLMSNVAFAHAKLGDDKRNLEILLETRALREQIGNAWGMSRTLSSIGAVYQRAGDLVQAEQVFTEALEAAESANALSEQFEILEHLAEVYEALGRDSDALAALRRAHDLEEEIDYPGAAKRIKELEAARRLAENELALARQSQRQRLLLIAGAFLVLLAVGLTAYARSRGRLLARVQQTALDLSESEQRYRSLFDDNAEPRFLIDLEAGRVIDANKPAARLCSTSADDLLGQELSKLQPDWLGRALSRSADAGDSPIGIHESWFTPAGEEEFADVWIAPVPLQGRRCALVAVHDTTADRREEEERIRRGQLESLGVLAGGIAHDFNNALSVVLGYVTLARTHLDEKSGTARLLGSAERSIDHAAKLSGNLLTFSAGGAPRRERHDIGLRLREAARVATAGSGVDLELTTATDLWNADVDLGQLNQLVSNLIRNAIEAMDNQGKLTLEAQNHHAAEPLSASVEAGNFVRIDVTDDGPGIPANIQGKVLNPYFTTTPGHTGLGLATAFAIASRHGGWLSFRSTEGHGTTFTVYLPASAQSRTETTEQDRTPASDQKTVLIMDDDQAIQRMYGRALSQLGYRTEITGDGEAAIDRYREAFERGESYDAVIMDLTVPGGMGGKAALAEIRGFDPAVRAIVASGYSNDPVMASYEESGFVAALHKPFSLQALSTLLQEVLDQETKKTQSGNLPNS